MGINNLLCVTFLVMVAECQSPTTDPNIAAIVAELRKMVQDLQQQVAAVHNTLQTQQTMSIDEVCKALTSSLGKKLRIDAMRVHDEVSNALTSSLGGTKTPKDCRDVKKAGSNSSGIYTIQPAGETTGREVYCDMDTDGGGWTVIQRRFDGSQDFYKSYAEYEEGFGNATGEYYLGNRLIHEITSSGKYELRVVLEDFQKVEKTEHYSEFSVGDSASKYQLHVAGPNGTAGDSLMFDHDGKKFSAPDADNDDTNNVNCAQKHHGGYWYSSCFKSNVNGQWGVAGEKGIVWGSFKDWNMYVLKRTVLEIRPVS